MDEAEFLNQAEQMLAGIENQVEKLAERMNLDIDLESQEGGILKLEFAQGAQIIINRHAAAKEIWIAARTGGFHFRWQEGQWKGTRDGREILACLSELISQQTGTNFELTGPQ